MIFFEGLLLVTFYLQAAIGGEWRWIWRWIHLVGSIIGMKLSVYCTLDSDITRETQTSKLWPGVPGGHPV
jgi:hypothetical protein